MSEKVLSDVAKELHLSHVTLQQVARKGTIPARKLGPIWLVDPETEEFKSWLEAHRHQPRVMGRKR